MDLYMLYIGDWYFHTALQLEISKQPIWIHVIGKSCLKMEASWPQS